MLALNDMFVSYTVLPYVHRDPVLMRTLAEELLSLTLVRVRGNVDADKLYAGVRGAYSDLRLPLSHLKIVVTVIPGRPSIRLTLMPPTGSRARRSAKDRHDVHLLGGVRGE
jgi:hypothetical protein